MRKAKQDWTTQELAEAADVTRRYITMILKSGELEGYKRGRDWFIDYEVGQAWLTKRIIKRALNTMPD